MKTSHIMTLLALFSLGMVLIIYDAALAVLILVNLIPVIFVLSAISAGYLVAIYFGLERPRSAFYRMLLGSVVAKVIIGGIIAGLVILSLLKIEAPGTPEQRRAFIIMLIGVLLTPPIFYAVTIWSGRRSATRQSGDRTLD